MIRRTTVAAVLALTTACGGARDQQQVADSTQRDLELVGGDTTGAMNDRPAAGGAAPATPKPAASTPATPKPAAAPRTMTLDTGTVVSASANDSLHSRHNKIGDLFHATVAADVKDARGHVAIPAGSVVVFRVEALEHANNRSDPDGKVRLQAQEVVIASKGYAIAGIARTVNIEHVLEGQGVTAGGAARVGGGAAGGAVVGGVVGGKTGAIVGGVAGAAAGTAAAVQTADRDVVIRSGMKLTFTLTSAFTISR